MLQAGEHPSASCYEFVIHIRASASSSFFLLAVYTRTSVAAFSSSPQLTGAQAQVKKSHPGLCGEKGRAQLSF